MKSMRTLWRARLRAATWTCSWSAPVHRPWLMPETLRWRFRDARIGVEVTPTGPAVRTYNILFAERRRIGAALIAVD